MAGDQTNSVVLHRPRRSSYCRKPTITSRKNNERRKGYSVCPSINFYTACLKGQTLDRMDPDRAACAVPPHGRHHESDEAGLRRESDCRDGIPGRRYLRPWGRRPDLCCSLHSSQHSGSRCDPINRLPRRRRRYSCTSWRSTFLACARPSLLCHPALGRALPARTETLRSRSATKIMAKPQLVGRGSGTSQNVSARCLKSCRLISRKGRKSAEP